MEMTAVRIRRLSARPIASLAASAGLLMAGLAAAAPAAAPAPGAQQAAPLYGVEMIVFRAASIGATEDWSAVPVARGFGSSANRGGPTPLVLRVLPASDYRLGAVESALRTSGAWRPIAHAAWIQSAANWGTHVGIPLSDLGIDVPGLSGMVYLERAPIYLHLGFDVTLDAGATYTIKDMRSVRYNDRQYFDHPAFGIIAVVTPIKHTDGASTR